VVGAISRSSRDYFLLHHFLQPGTYSIKLFFAMNFTNIDILASLMKTVGPGLTLIFAINYTNIGM